MKRILTIFLAVVCIMITLLIVKIDDYAQTEANSQNPVEELVNNKLENLTKDEIIELIEKINDKNTTNKTDENKNKDIDETNIIKINNKSKLEQVIDMLREKKKVCYKDIDKQIMLKTKNSSFFPWYGVIYETKELSYKLDNNNNVEWIEVDDKENVFGRKLNNFKDIQDMLGKDNVSIKKLNNQDFNYEYYELTYDCDDINIRFMSYYEDGTSNICIVS